MYGNGMLFLFQDHHMTLECAPVISSPITLATTRDPAQFTTSKQAGWKTPFVPIFQPEPAKTGQKGPPFVLGQATGINEDLKSDLSGKPLIEINGGGWIKIKVRRSQ